MLALTTQKLGLTRFSLLHVLSQDYVRTARAKGLPELVVLYRHALKNALIPAVTVAALRLGAVLGGAVITEQVFAWSWVGVPVVNAVNTRDYPVVQGTVLLMATVFVLLNLTVDLVYGLIHPRIRFDWRGLALALVVVALLVPVLAP